MYNLDCFFLVQSLTLPLSGFLNAIVYGWTREDFINVLTFSEQMAYSAEIVNSETEGMDRSLLTETLDDRDFPNSQGSPFTETDNDQLQAKPFLISRNFFDFTLVSFKSQKLFYCSTVSPGPFITLNHVINLPKERFLL